MTPQFRRYAMDTVLEPFGAMNGIRNAGLISQSASAETRIAATRAMDSAHEYTANEPAISNPVNDLEKKIQSQLGMSDISITFAVYGNNKIAIKVLNNETGEVIREIPPEEIQKLSENLGDMAGILVDKDA
jgi:flagellar protein FlaG